MNNTDPANAPDISAVGARVDRVVRRPGTYLCMPAECWNTAEQCQQMGLSVGDTITGREHGGGGRWHDARLTLLWIGRQECMWLVQERTEAEPAWTEPHEAGDWTLDCRRWRLTPMKTAGMRH